MKKVQFMLIAIAILATSGGLVAAKVAKGLTTFCTTATINATTCFQAAGNIVWAHIGSGSLACTASPIDDGQGSLACPDSGYATALTRVVD